MVDAVKIQSTQTVIKFGYRTRKRFDGVFFGSIVREIEGRTSEGNAHNLICFIAYVGYVLSVFELCRYSYRALGLTRLSTVSAHELVKTS